jgi:hypothetical protein
LIDGKGPVREFRGDYARRVSCMKETRSLDDRSKETPQQYAFEDIFER